MAKQRYRNNVITPEARLSYPYVVDQLVTQIDGRVVEKWCVDLLFSKDTDLSALDNIVKELIKEQWPDATPQLVKKIRTPFKDGNDKLDKEGNVKPGYHDTIFITIDTKRSAPVLRAANGEPMTADQGREEIYGGCYGRALVNGGTYDHMGNKGVKFYLSALQKTRDGEPLGEGSTTSEQVDRLMDAFGKQETTTDNSDLLS